MGEISVEKLSGQDESKISFDQLNKPSEMAEDLVDKEDNGPSSILSGTKLYERDP